MYLGAYGGSFLCEEPVSDQLGNDAGEQTCIYFFRCVVRSYQTGTANEPRYQQCHGNKNGKTDIL